MERVRRAVLGRGRLRRGQRLGDHLAAEHPADAVAPARAFEAVFAERLQLEQPQQLGDERFGRRADLVSRLRGRQRGEQQQGDDVGDLDHRVHRRAGGVLVGIADRVAGHRGLVRLGALAAVVAVLDVLLGVVPRAAAGGHRDRHEQAADDHAKQQRAERREAVRPARRSR